MNDSTPHLDEFGIYREQPILPVRHPVKPSILDALAPIAYLGEPGSVERMGWINILRVHGFERVMRAAAWCLRNAEIHGLVSNEQTQRVLDGKDGRALEQEMIYQLHVGPRAG